MPRGRIPDAEGKRAALYALVLIIGVLMFMGGMLWILNEIGRGA